jgi:hypothetical protein
MTGVARIRAEEARLIEHLGTNFDLARRLRMHKQHKMR